MELMERRRILLNTPHIDIVTGFQFVTDMVAPLESLVISFSPIQDLHGYDNPWVAGGGTNKWNEEWEVGSLTNQGTDYASTTRLRSKGYIPILAETTYYAKTNEIIDLHFYDSNYTHLSYIQKSNSTFTTPENAAYLRFCTAVAYGTTYNHDIAINYPSTVTTYSPYENVCPITGRTGLDVTRTGKNLCMAPTFSEVTNGLATWSTKPSNYTTLAGRLNELAPGDYVISCEFTLVTRNDTSDNSTCGVYILFNDGTSFGNHNLAVNKWGTKTVGDKHTVSLPITITESLAGTVKDLRFYGCGVNGVGTTGSASVSNFQVEKGSVGTAYEPYTIQTITVDWTDTAGTVYGGTLDVTTGVLTVTKVLYEPDAVVTVSYHQATGLYYWVVANASNIPYPAPSNNVAEIISSHFKEVNSVIPGGCYVTSLGQIIIAVPVDQSLNTRELATAWIQENHPTFCYKIAQPFEYQLTSQQVLALKGTNNLSHSSQIKFWTHRDLTEQPALLSMSSPLSFGLSLEPAEENEEMESA